MTPHAPVLPFFDPPQRQTADTARRQVKASKSLTEQLADHFRAHPNVWIDGRSLEFAGRYAWRTRTSELRKAPWHMTIENQVYRVTAADGTTYQVSEYRFVTEGESDRNNGAEVGESA